MKKDKIADSHSMVLKKSMAPEAHRSAHINWLRAAVLGANDGIISTASLIVGVASANTSQQNIILTGAAGLVAGAMSMAAGEFVSVSSQADIERADLSREKAELESNEEFELEELAQIYVGRGLDISLAHKVAEQLMTYDALGSHARDELGITNELRPRPIQAAAVSAGSFSIGAAMPLVLTLVLPRSNFVFYLSISSLVLLVFLGVFAAKIGGANIIRGAIRVAFWGSLAMLATAAIGNYFG